MRTLTRLAPALLFLLSAAPARGTEPDPEAKARAYFTDTVLVTHEGKEVRFYSDVLADRVVVLDFIFTRCEMACPLLTEKMNRVREQIGPLYGKEVHFVSLSVDPEFDTPQELTRFAKKHGGLMEGWTWLTGKKEDVKLVLRRLGTWVDDPDQHTTEFILGNTRTRHWLRARPEWPAAHTAMKVKGLAAEGGPALQSARSPAEAAGGRPH